MAFTSEIFNTSGKIPTEANFWSETDPKNFVTDDGITSGFSRIIGEQVFRPLKSPRTPFYQRFAGAPIEEGKGWKERALKQTEMMAFKPKATAEDNFKYYDSTGIEKAYEVNVAGWKPVSVPSDLVSLDMFVERNGIGQLNSMLVDNVLLTYQNAIESQIEKKAISSTKNEMSVDTSDIVTAFGQIMDKASEMISDDIQFNELTDEENDGLINHSERIYCFVNQKILNAYKNAKASVYNPSELVNNVEIVPMVNELPAPITTAEWTAGPRDGVDWKDKPVAIDGAKPIAYLCASDKIVYRPVKGSYKLNLARNGAGDFDNTHLIYRGCIAVRPWENAVRVNAVSTTSKSKA